MGMAAKGCVTVSIEYRLFQESTFPAAVEDSKCAVRWLRANASGYHVDPGQLAAIGLSAGGHLALMVAYTSGLNELEGTGGNEEGSSAVQAVVSLYGPTDMTNVSLMAASGLTCLRRPCAPIRRPGPRGAPRQPEGPGA